MNVRTEPVGKHFGDNLEDGVEKTNGLKIINQGSTFFFRNESNESIIEAPKIHGAIIKMAK